jgi:nitronate monooxygenase
VTTATRFVEQHETSTLGAAGVQIGTTYLLAHEASTSAVHRAALLSSEVEHTALTNLFTGRPARGILMAGMSPFRTGLVPARELT